ncbi:MAG: hypothetical protein AAF543_00300 [Pseudomonadota bacterium]
MGLALAGCQDLVGNTNDDGAQVLESLDSGGLSDRLRKVAIQVGDDFFMIPTGLDEDGCETFKPHSANNPVKAAIYYRQADGTFGIARDPDICKVEMTSIGPDADGCERFRAVPVNADLPVEQEVIYYQAGDGGFSPRKPRASCG